MPGIEHLVRKILSDAADEARRIEDAGREEAASIAASYERRARANTAETMAMATEEAAAGKARLLAAAELAARDKRLAAKQRLIERALAAAVQKLNGMDDKQYAAYLSKQLGGAALPDGTEVIVPERLRGKVDLKAANPRLRLSRSGRKINGGFVLVSAESESNNTFEALAGYKRADLERLVIDKCRLS